jgi:hypothetical protein
MMSRCTTRACPVRFRSGPDRPCPWCEDDAHATFVSRAAGFAVMITMPSDDDE